MAELHCGAPRPQGEEGGQAARGRDLQTHFLTSAGLVKAIDGISYEVGEGETVAVVGESGCGKSVDALSILRLIPSPPGRIVGGSVHFNGRNLLTLSEEEIRRALQAGMPLPLGFVPPCLPTKAQQPPTGRSGWFLT
jgi:ABC-type antimicrobial peptide transport system ATPase subunit